MLVVMHLPSRQTKKGKHFTSNVESGFGLFFYKDFRFENQ